MPEKMDFKKAYKDLYLPGKKPALVQVPAMPFIAVNGCGAPESPAYQNGIGVLYALTFTIKMSKMGGNAPEGYFEYVVPPLEGLWETGAHGENPQNRASWNWCSFIRQPDFVTEAVFAQALDSAKKKKPQLDFSAAFFEVWEEGLCVQALHTGPYSTEPETLAAMHRFIEDAGYTEDFTSDTAGLSRRHHEIYLGDPRKTAPEKRRTVLRHPVTKL